MPGTKKRFSVAGTSTVRCQETIRYFRDERMYGRQPRADDMCKLIADMINTRRLLRLTILLKVAFSAVATVWAGQAMASDDRWTFGIETGAVWQNRNDVQIPGNSGTRFSLSDLAGEGPLPFYRLEASVDVAPRHQVRFLVAPFSYAENGVLDKDVFFVDQTFSAGQATEASYRFNSYRVTYRYLFHDTSSWRWWIGATAKIRDAEIALSQNGATASDSNVGVVPLAHLYGERPLTTDWRFVVDVDGLVGPQGRAIDLGLKVHYDIGKRWFVGVGYRTLEGGADNDEVYNFAWFNYALISFGYR